MKGAAHLSVTVLIFTEFLLACKNSRFPSVLDAGEVARNVARNEVKRLFSQAKFLEFNFSPHIASPVQGPVVHRVSFSFCSKAFSSIIFTIPNNTASNHQITDKKS